MRRGRLIGTSKHLPGQALIEILIASGVFLIGVMSIFSLVLGSSSLARDSDPSRRASEYARQGIDAVRLIRNQDWETLQDGTYGLQFTNNSWSLVPGNNSSNGFTRELTLTTYSGNQKILKSRVVWQPSSLRTSELTFVTALTNWQNTQDNNYVAGDWAHPTSLGTVDIENGAAGTDVVVNNQRAYVSSKATNVEKVDFSTFNVAHATNATRDASLDLGISNLASIAKSGNYVYGAISGSTKEFLVLDVTNPAAPTIVGQHDFSNGKTQSIAVAGNYLYLGMEQIAGEAELYVFDVTTPASPTLLGNFEIGATVWSIGIFNNRAYLATDADSEELIILDVADPSAITKSGAYNANGTVNGKNVFVKDEYNVYLGRENSASDPEFLILDASNVSGITVKGSYDMNTGINDMVVANRYAFLATELPNAEFKVLDVANPATITDHGTLNFSQSVTGIAYENNTIYCSVRSNDVLHIIGPG